MGKRIISLLAFIFVASASAEPKVTYVGQGRYACSGRERECEPIRRRNDEVELRRQQARDLEELRHELGKQGDRFDGEQGHQGNEKSLAD